MSDNDDENVVLRLTLRTDGTVEIWLNGGRPASEVAAMLREVADGFENDPQRIS